MASKNQIPMYPLRDVLDEHLQPGQVIVFLSIDVEGLDQQVIESNDWVRFRPFFVPVEALEARDIRDALPLKISSLLEQNSYVMYAKCVNTLIFKAKSE